MPMIILLTLFVLVGYGIKKNTSGTKPFEPGQSLALRGICAIEIMIGHIGLETGNRILFPNRKAGILFVGIFFLLSGYGLAYSAENKEGYFKNFLLKRSIRLLLPLYVTKIIMIAFENVIVFDRGIFTGFDVKQFLLVMNWYIWEQLFFYLVYWLAHKVIPKHVEIAVGASSVLLIIIAYVSGMDNPWYGSSLCFLLGLCYYKLEKKNIKLTCTGYCALFVFLAFILIISITAFFVLGNNSILGNPVARNIASLSFCVIVIMLLYRLRVENCVSIFLGECSYEIFLVHPYVLAILKAMSVTSKEILGIATAVLTVLLAHIIHLFIAGFWGLVRRD